VKVDLRGFGVLVAEPEGDDRGVDASLLSHATDLDQLVRDRYPNEHLADDFHQSNREVQTALRHKAHSDS
jgi:hypothetical protein